MADLVGAPMRRFAGSVLFGLAAFSGCGSAVDPGQTSHATTTTTLASRSPTETSSASVLIDLLLVAPEGSQIEYDPTRFAHWVDRDRDGCDTRCEVLEAERRTDLAGLRSGWLSIYDGYTTDDPGELDVDHVVALAEAWRSGADGWDPERRERFANDLEEPDALVAVTASTNRSKGDRDPASWQPPNRAAWCQWGLGWVRVKIKWGLTADAAEVQALRNILSECQATSADRGR